MLPAVLVPEVELLESYGLWILNPTSASSSVDVGRVPIFEFIGILGAYLLEFVLQLDERAIGMAFVKPKFDIWGEVELLHGPLCFL